MEKNLMGASEWIALAALVVSLVSLAITLYEKLRSEQESVIKALQGEKENVAFIALKVSNRQWPNNPFSDQYRDDVIASLCLAWIMTRSDRARALVLAALRELNTNLGNNRKIGEILKGIELQFISYVNTAYSNNPAAGQRRIQKGLDKAKQLRGALSI